jgi:hypothetical protein
MGRSAPWTFGMSSGRPSDRRLLADNYMILETIDEEARVIKAHDRRNRRVVALKGLGPWSAIDPETLRMFERASRWEHPNLARVFGVVEDRGHRFLAMEYVDGTDLERIVRHRGPLPFDQATDVLIQAARGLEASHAHGIVHGGLKPSKLVLGAMGMVRVLGPAPRAEGDEQGLRSADYTAPEHAESPRASPRADIYSLGCILHFLLMGREPFVAETLGDRVAAHRDRPAPDLRILRPDVPSALAATYQRMMAKRPEDRPASMTEVIGLLESGKPAEIGPEFDLAGLGIEGHPGPAREPRGHLTRATIGIRPDEAAPPRPISRVAVALGLAAIAALIAVVARLAPRSGDAGSPTVAAPPAAVDGEDRPKPSPEPVWVARTIFGGRDAGEWMLTNKRPVPRGNLQPDGLNPRGAGSYLVVYRRPLGDFILDFDYKLGPGCDSGVFLRVGDLDDPLHTGIEVSLRDSTGEGDEDSGAFRGLVTPSANAQKPAGAWNHMTITARGPSIAVTLNGIEVSRIQLDEWTVPGRRPDGTSHDWTNVALAKIPRSGYLGLQDLVGDCWFRDVVVRTPDRR